MVKEEKGHLTTTIVLGSLQPNGLQLGYSSSSDGEERKIEVATLGGPMGVTHGLLFVSIYLSSL